MPSGERELRVNVEMTSVTFEIEWKSRKLSQKCAAAVTTQFICETKTLTDLEAK